MRTCTTVYTRLYTVDLVVSVLQICVLVLQLKNEVLQNEIYYNPFRPCFAAILYCYPLMSFLTSFIHFKTIFIFTRTISILFEHFKNKN